MRFQSCPRPTVGVEWELQLLDANTLDLVDGITPLMDLNQPTPYIKPELIQSCVEINSGICGDSCEVGERLRTVLTSLDNRCRELSMRLAASGTHPFSRRLALITPLPRYRQSEEQYGLLAQQQITFALHVHVGLPSGDIAVRVMRELAPYLPLLMAVSANSPFWRGYDTGFACYRQRILAASRNYGLPESFDDWRAFREFIDLARRVGAVDSIRDIHWDVRPNPEFGTLELRIMDAPSTLAHLLTQTALARAMIVWLADDQGNNTRLEALPAWLARENYFEASRAGMNCNMVIDADGTTVPMRELLGDVLARIEPTARELGEYDALAGIRNVVAGGTGYELQRRLVRSGDVGSLMHGLVDVMESDLERRPAPVRAAN